MMADSVDISALRPGSVVKADDAGVLIDAQAIHASAMAERDAARAEAADLRQSAREAGYRDGLTEAAAASARILAAGQAQLQAMTDRLAPALAEAATDAAAQIVGEATDPETVGRVIRTALARASRHRQLRLFVWPEAADRVRADLNSASSDTTPPEDLVTVDADPRLTPGRIVLASERGYVELGVAEQLDAAREAISHHLAAELTPEGDA